MGGDHATSVPHDAKVLSVRAMYEPNMADGGRGIDRSRGEDNRRRSPADPPGQERPEDVLRSVGSQAAHEDGVSDHK
eukprot:9792524-Alexandrium_andersonii.AAC.1